MSETTDLIDEYFERLEEEFTEENKSLEEITMAKIKIDKKYVRCRFCDSSWFIYTLKDSNNVYKETPKMLQYNCPTCGHVQTSRKFNTDEEDLPDNMKEIK